MERTAPAAAPVGLPPGAAAPPGRRPRLRAPASLPPSSPACCRTDQPSPAMKRNVKASPDHSSMEQESSESDIDSGGRRAGGSLWAIAAVVTAKRLASTLPSLLTLLQANTPTGCLPLPFTPPAAQSWSGRAGAGAGGAHAAAPTSRAWCGCPKCTPTLKPRWKHWVSVEAAAGCAN